MSLKLFKISIFLTIALAASASFSQVERMGRIPLSIEIEPGEFRLPDIDNGERNYTSFDQWAQCYPNCPACEPDGTPQVDLIDLGVGNRCLPTGARDREIVFNSELTDDSRIFRDRRICECLNSSQTGMIERLSYMIGENTTDFREGLRDRARQTSRQIFEEKLHHSLTEERYLSAFSVMSFAEDPTEAVAMGGRYTAANIGLFNDLRREHPRLQSLANEELSDDVLTGANVPANFCIDYPTFLASQQIPREPEFFQDLRSSTRYREDQWNFRELSIRLDRLFRNQTSGFEQFLAANPEAKMIERRLAFLHNNPVIRNIFMARGRGEEKRELFRILTQLPQRNCNGNVCREDANWGRQLEAHRERMREFLRQRDVIQAASSGVAEFSKFSHEQLGERSFRNTITAEGILEGSYSSDSARWTAYCEVRGDLLQQSNRNLNFAYSYLSLPERHPDEPGEDGEFTRLNEAVCNQPRRGPRGQMTFATFLRGSCGTSCTSEQRRGAVAAFLNAYPDSLGEDSPLVGQIMPFLEGPASPVRLGKDNVRELSQIARNPALARSPINYVPPGKSGGSAQGSTARSSARVVDTSATANLVSPGAVSSGIGPVSQVASSQPLLSPRVEAQRQDLFQGETEAQRIRSDIASIRDSITRPQAQGGPSSTELQGLNQRLLGLEQRLRDRETENARLRTEIAATSTSRDIADPRSSELPERRRGETGDFGASPQASGGSTAGVNPQFLPQQSGGSLAGLAPRIDAPAARQVQSGGISRALLERYGVEPGFTNTQNGIVVANSSGSIDYQLLRSQSENSVLPLNVSPEEFALLSLNNQEIVQRYSDRIRSVPGEVIRVNLVGGENQNLELFIVRNNTGIAIIQSSGGRAPASALLEPQRQATLDNLRRDLTTD